MVEQLAHVEDRVDRHTGHPHVAGDAWVVAELRKVSSTLLGSVMDVADPKDLEADFRAMTQAAMGKTVADIALRVWTPQQATLKFIKQVSPALEDLTASADAAGTSMIENRSAICTMPRSRDDSPASFAIAPIKSAGLMPAWRPAPMKIRAASSDAPPHP